MRLDRLHELMQSDNPFFDEQALKASINMGSIKKARQFQH